MVYLIYWEHIILNFINNNDSESYHEVVFIPKFKAVWGIPRVISGSVTGQIFSM